MAKEPKSAAKPAENKKAGGKGGGATGLIVALALLTGIGGGGGFMFGRMLRGSQSAPAAGASAAPETEHPAPEASAHGAAATAEAKAAAPPGEIIPLPPIITNLMEPKGAFIRIEGGIRVEAGYADQKVLAAKVSEDILTLLRATALSQIEGSAGLNHLRDDINDRVRIRSEGKAQELVINGLVIE